MSKRLKLDLDVLQVESFDTLSGVGPRAGTVFAFISLNGCDTAEGACTGNQSCLAACSAYCEPASFPCSMQAFTCPPPTEQTCETACNSGCATCLNMSCQYTCGISCEQFECGTCDFMTRCW